MPSISPQERAANVFLPYGPWAVVCPFNFPFGITMGMLVGVLVTGNSAVLKPASPSPAPVYAIYDAMTRAGLPPGVLNLVSGSGQEVGEALVKHPKIEGVIFTGSKEVGQSILRQNIERRYPIPIILELGGKNAAIVSDKADLDRAVRGVVSSAFGYSGQKCVACSRVYVHNRVPEALLSMLFNETRAFRVADGGASLYEYDPDAGLVHNLTVPIQSCLGTRGAFQGVLDINDAWQVAGVFAGLDGRSHAFRCSLAKLPDGTIVAANFEQICEPTRLPWITAMRSIIGGT